MPVPKKSCLFRGTVGSVGRASLAEALCHEIAAAALAYMRNTPARSTFGCRISRAHVSCKR